MHINIYINIDLFIYLLLHNIKSQPDVSQIQGPNKNPAHLQGGESQGMAADILSGRKCCLFVLFVLDVGCLDAKE